MREDNLKMIRNGTYTNAKNLRWNCGFATGTHTGGFLHGLVQLRVVTLQSLSRGFNTLVYTRFSSTDFICGALVEDSPWMGITTARLFTSSSRWILLWGITNKDSLIVKRNKKIVLGHINQK